MKKSLKILSLVALISLTGCGDKEKVNSSLNNTELDTVITENVDATKAKLETVLKGEKVGVKVSASVNESVNIVINGQTLSNAVMSESIDAIGNIDMKAGKEYYDEYLAREFEEVYDEYYGFTQIVMKINEEKIAETAAKDTSSYYLKINSSMSEAGQSDSTTREVWYLPTSMTLKADGQTQESPHDGSMNYMFYEYTQIAKEALEEMKNTSNAALPEEYQVIVDFFEGKATSEEFLPVFVELVYMVADIEFDISDPYTRQLLIDILNEVQKIDYASLYVASTVEKEGELTLTVSMDKAAIQANILTLINAFKTSYIKILTSTGVDANSIAMLTAEFDLIINDVKNNMPSTFDVHSKMTFKDGIVTSSEEVCKLAGNIPQYGLMMLGIDPTKTTGACTYSINMDSKASIEFGNEYYAVPAKA